MLAHEHFGSTAVCVLTRTYPRSSERSLAGSLPAEKANSRVPSVDAIGIKLSISYPANQFLTLSTKNFWRHLPKCISYHHWTPKQDIVKLVYTIASWLKWLSFQQKESSHWGLYKVFLWIFFATSSSVQTGLVSDHRWAIGPLAWDGRQMAKD